MNNKKETTMGRVSFSPRQYTQVREEMNSVTKYPGNAHQNHNVVSLYTC